MYIFYINRIDQMNLYKKVGPNMRLTLLPKIKYTIMYVNINNEHTLQSGW